MQCRICFEEGDPTTLLSPCNCRGTASYIHQPCLDRYIQYYPDRICRVCNAEFNYESPEDFLGFSLMVGSLSAMLLYSNVSIVGKLSLFGAILVLSFYLLKLRLIESTLLSLLLILAIIFFPGGQRDAMYVFLALIGILAFMFTLAQQLSAVVLLGIVVTTMLAGYSGFFLYLAFHAMDPPGFTVVLCVYFMAWYLWIYMRQPRQPRQPRS